MQQILYGLYPPNAKKTMAPWEIAIRPREEETLLPNTKSCARLAELVREFSREASKKWNVSDEMKYLSEKIGLWMPGNKLVALDSRPRLSAIMDSIHATAAHGTDTRLPDEFYDEKLRKTIDRIVMDEMFHGYRTSRELRVLGLGQLVGDMALKMVDQVDWDRGYGGGSRHPPRLSLLGCHDRTIGAVLASIGCLDGDERWPAFTSHIVFELFRKEIDTSFIRHKGRSPAIAEE
jgi:acid phosphatase